MPATVKVSTVISVKKFFGMTSKEMQNEWKQLGPQDKLDYCDMLPAVGIHPTDRAGFVAKLPSN